MKKALPSAGLGKIASEILLPKTSVIQRSDVFRRHTPFMLKSKNLTATDRWLREAIYHQKGEQEARSSIILFLPKVLKTLQKLRSSDRRASYFALMNKIKSSRIKWISHSGKLIQDNEDIPLEFFHELSVMLNRMSSTGQSPLDMNTMKIFTFQLMSQYQILMISKSISNLSQTTRFYKNCIIITTKNGSISHLFELLNHIPKERKGLKILAELAFYQQSNQVFKALDFVEQKILYPGSVHLQENEVTEFFSVFLSIMQTSISNGEEDTCCKLLGKLSNDWKYVISPHDCKILRELSERTASTKIQIALDQHYPNLSEKVVPWRILQSKLDWSQYIASLSDMDINLFLDEQDLTFLQFKLASVGPSIFDWVTFLQQTKLPANANESVKAFSIHTILLYLAANRNPGFVISVLEHLLYEMNYTQDFLNTQKLAGQSKCSNFHILFRTIANSSSSVLSANLILKYLLHENKLPFSFNANDFYYMMRTCLSGSNHQAIYYFLYQCILILGPSFYHKSEGHILWSIPPQIQLFFESYYFRAKNGSRALELVKEVGDWLTKHASATGNLAIDENTLKSIFAGEYVPEIDLNVLQAWEIKSDFADSHERMRYFPSADMAMCERLNDLLKHVAERNQI